MDPPRSHLAHSFKRQGDLIESSLSVFHIETVLNNRAFDGPLGFLTKNEDDFTEADRLKFQAMKWTLDKLGAGLGFSGLSLARDGRTLVAVRTDDQSDIWMVGSPEPTPGTP